MVKQLYSEKFEQIIQFARSVGRLCGADVVDKNFKPSGRTLLIFILINCGIFVTLYTAFYESVILGDYYSVFKSFSIVGSGVQGYVKFLTGINRFKSVDYVYVEYKNLYVTCEKKSLAYQNSLIRADSLVRKFLIYTFSLVVIALISILSVPVIWSVFYNVHVDVVPFHLPFLDYETGAGFYLTAALQVTCIILALFGNFACDALLFIFVCHIPMIKDILQCKFDDLDDVLNADADNFATSNELLKDIIKFHQFYNNICNMVKNMFFWIIFVQISTEFIGLACTVVVIFLNIWPSAPVFGLYLFSMIYLYCAMGNVVDSANDDITIMVYNFCWYKLNVSQQKMILIMLRDSQRASGITVGDVAPLTLSTALQLTKTIYTLSMVLKEMFV